MTTMGLIKISYKTAYDEGNYGRLKKLEAYGYIKRRIVDDGALGWILTKKGYQFIRPELDGLKSDRIVPPHPWHDLYASAFHIGEWYRSPPPNVQMVSEQEITCIDKRMLPENTPVSPNHVPDGVTLIRKSDCNILIGFELELTQKASYRYEVFASYYDALNFKHVFWCVENAKLADSIYRVIESKVGVQVKMHNFILFDDLKSGLWKSKFIAGEFKGLAMNAALMRLAYANNTPRLRNSEMDWVVCTQKSPRFLRDYDK